MAKEEPFIGSDSSGHEFVSTCCRGSPLRWSLKERGYVCAEISRICISGHLQTSKHNERSQRTISFCLQFLRIKEGSETDEADDFISFQKNRFLKKTRLAPGFFF